MDTDSSILGSRVEKVGWHTFSRDFTDDFDFSYLNTSKEFEIRPIRS